MLTFATYKSNKKSLTENLEIIKKVISCLDWKIIKEYEDGIESKTSVSLSSFGENIRIKVFNENINITIESKVKMTIADAGKGNLLVKSFIEELQRQEQE